MTNPETNPETDPETDPRPGPWRLLEPAAVMREADRARAAA